MVARFRALAHPGRLGCVIEDHLRDNIREINCFAARSKSVFWVGTFLEHCHEAKVIKFEALRVDSSPSPVFYFYYILWTSPGIALGR